MKKEWKIKLIKVAEAETSNDAIDKDKYKIQ